MDSVQSIASSSSSTVPSSERTSHFSSQTEMEMESSKARHWSQLDHPTPDLEGLVESDHKYFALLKEDPQWSRFFTDFETLEVGEKISGGAQADIYEARNKSDGPFNLVVKVMKADASLKTFHAQWPIGMLSARSKYKHLFDLPLITILGGTMLRDQRLRGRFAFVMYRRWGDLRLLIDRRMKQERNGPGPFTIDEVIHLMSSIAKDMDTLHNNHDILHRDLKASNVLVWGEFGEDMNLIVTSNPVARIGSVVADFECSVGVLGTGFWRAPEILEQCKARVCSAEVQFTRASDVYSYGMICYEIVTGCIPFDGHGGQDMISQILQGRCPELPHELPEFVRDIIFGCWHSDSLERPSFSTICMALKLRRGPNLVSVVIDNKSENGASIVKVEKPNNPQASTLLEVMQKLMDMDLSILKAFDLISTTMTSQFFEVINCEGRKVVDDKSIANITKALSLTRKTKCISEILETSIYGNTIEQMYVIEVIAKWSAGLLGAISKLLVATNFRVQLAGCCTHEGRVECVIYVEGTRMGTFLWELRHNMEYFPISTGSFRIIVHKVCDAKFSHVNRRLYNLKSIDLTLPPRSSSKICLHLRKKFEELWTTKVIVCFENQLSLLNIYYNLQSLNYEIYQASRGVTDDPILYDLCLRDKANILISRGTEGQSKHIDFQTLFQDAWKKLKTILKIAKERKYLETSVELSIFGPSEELHHALMRIISRYGDHLVSGGQVFRGGWEYGTDPSVCSGELVFFTTKVGSRSCLRQRSLVTL